MRIDVFLVPEEVPEYFTKGRRVVLVDVLRACTSLTVALESGAERIVPTDSIEGAKQLLALLDRKHTLLAGEKDGLKVAGFDLGNSPGDLRDPIVAGKTIVFTSDSGSPLMARMYDEVEKPLLSFLNVSAVAGHLLETGDQEHAVLCAGQEGRFSLEDTICAGMLCRKLLDRAPAGQTPWDLSDAARAALALYEAARDCLLETVSLSSWARRLIENGMAADIEEACRVDSASLIPVVREGRIVPLRPASSSA